MAPAPKKKLARWVLLQLKGSAWLSGVHEGRNETEVLFATPPGPHPQFSAGVLIIAHGLALMS